MAKISFEEFVKKVEEDVKKTPEVFKRYQARGGSQDEDAAFFLKSAYREFQNGEEERFAINNASSNIFMEY